MKRKKSKLASSGHGGSVAPEISLHALIEREQLRQKLKKRGRRLKAMKREWRHGKSQEEING